MPMSDTRQTDPGLLELLGELLDLVGLAEHIQRFLPTQRLKVQRRHRRVEKLLDTFNETLSDGRAALRVVSTTVERHVQDSAELDTPRETGVPTASALPRIAFSMPREELPVYRRGIEHLQSAIHRLTKIAFDLEATSAGVQDEVQRYYKISEAGNAVLRNIRHALEDRPESIPALVREVESFLARCSRAIEDRGRWIDE
ncbi:MAG: hypothetical protein HY721_02020 [Planctomycetes bacterium]|nr:hypothetical protein [Planctomycetota bacterium]